ncbi:MAG: aminopeptidase N [Azospirillaceae bacterium]
MMRKGAHRPIKLEDYSPPAYLAESCDLVFELAPAETLVKSRLVLTRNPEGDAGAPLTLDGDGLELVSIERDGEALGPNGYGIGDDGRLTIHDAADRVTLDIVTRIRPDRNTALSGLYYSGTTLTTQCEPEGFRRITYFPDRPDVLTRFTATLVADKGAFPVLLANGNCIDGGETADGRHWSKWEDPWPKPSYLFAIVAGDLDALRDTFTTGSGRRVDLAIWAKAKDLDRCAFAMEALKKAMAWDEAVFGLEYDLDIFNIVVVPDFNFGAMENKSLNVFNTALLLARPETATDADYQRIEGVVAHEYFHNWTGNRITCRDWFQLTLKEGLTVFRDQEFSADHGSRPVQRIRDVRRLRALQFPEDSGPLAHPIQPSSYISIDNFYTPTVYEKGAEVIRMMYAFLGRDGFRRGMDLYVARHDLQAITCEDFRTAMRDANTGREGGDGLALEGIERWYEQAGTPHVTAEESWDPAAGRFTLTLRQETPATPGQEAKKPLPMPVALGLIGPDGADRPVILEGEDADAVVAGTRVLRFAEAEQSWTFTGLDARPLPSLFRGFSAPVKLKGQPRDRLAFLFGHDTDSFARWDAGQQLATDLLLGMVEAVRDGREPELDAGFVEAWGRTLADTGLDRALIAETLTLPGEDYVAEQMTVVDVEAIHAAREAARRQLACAHAATLAHLEESLRDAGPYRYTPEEVGRRALKGLCLSLMAAGPDRDAAVATATAEVGAATTMTEVMAALTVLNDIDGPERQNALDTFYDRWRDDALVVDKWFGLQARSALPDTVERVRELSRHPAFDRRTPNRARALIGAFAMGNPLRFQRPDGAGYALLVDEVLQIDRLNPLLAARLLTPLGRWRRQDAGRQALMKAELERVLATEGLSRDTWEIASKSLE